jgi:hypothetical protein
VWQQGIFMISSLKGSKSNVLLEFIELVSQEGQVTVDFFGIGDDGIDLVREPHILCFLSHQIIFA